MVKGFNFKVDSYFYLIYIKRLHYYLAHRDYAANEK